MAITKTRTVKRIVLDLDADHVTVQWTVKGFEDGVPFAERTGEKEYLSTDQAELTADLPNAAPRIILLMGW